jgi:hypothetical protein
VSWCLLAAAEADLSSDMRLRVLSVFTDLDPTSLGQALSALARCGDMQCTAAAAALSFWLVASGFGCRAGGVRGPHSDDDAAA